MLLQRVLTAIVLLALILPTVFVLPALSWGLLTLVFLAIAGWEWYRLRPQAAASQSAVLPAMAVAIALVMMGLGWLYWLTAWPQSAVMQDRAAQVLLVLASAYWIVIAPWRLWRLDVASGGGALVIGLLLACWVALYRLREQGAEVLIVALAIVWIADVGAYFVGRAIGRRKLAPAISPGKSWEGAVGGAFFVAAAGLISAAAPGLDASLPARLVSQWGPWVGVVVFVGLAALSVLGDLHESLLKRQANVKDSGRILPGHGGMLDRVDALISTVPVIGLLHWILA